MKALGTKERNAVYARYAAEGHGLALDDELLPTELPMSDAEGLRREYL